MAKKTEVKEYVKKDKVTPEQLAEALALLNKSIDRKKRIESGELKSGKKWSELTEDEKQKFRDKNAERNARISIMVMKGEKAGIKVTPAEITAYLAAKKK